MLPLFVTYLPGLSVTYLSGSYLAKIIELLHDHSLGSVTPLDARCSNALGKAPWVSRIVVSRIDKPA